MGTNRVHYLLKTLFYHVYGLLPNLSACRPYSLSQICKSLFKYLICIAYIWPHQADATRLIAGSPAITELLFQLGKGSDVVGVSDQSFYPEEAKKLPIIGSLFTPSIEKTLKLSPDIVVLDSFTKNDHYKQALNALKIPSLTLKIYSVESLFSESERLLRDVFKETNSLFIKNHKAKWEIFKKKSRSSFSYLAFVWMDPPILVGSQTFLSNLFTTAGGKNILPETITLPYPQVSNEWLLQKKPDTVFYLEESPETAKLFRAQVEKWWPESPPKIIGFNPMHFARTSFTPLAYLDELGSF